LEGRKISTSHNWAIWVKDIIERYDGDSIRYFLTANGPEKRDTDFSWREFVNSHNGELLGAYGNLVNRTLQFIHKYLGGIVPNGEKDAQITERIETLFQSCAAEIEQGNFKQALDSIFEFIRYGNKYFDTEQPWITRTENNKKCQETIYNCMQIIANLAILLNPFLPFSSSKIISWLSLNECWSPQFIASGYGIPQPEILFERLDKKTVEIELDRLKTV